MVQLELRKQRLEGPLNKTESFVMTVENNESSNIV